MESNTIISVPKGAVHSIALEAAKISYVSKGYSPDLPPEKVAIELVKLYQEAKSAIREDGIAREN